MRNLVRLGLVGVTLCGIGCTLTKTENPLSPTIAGPLPGVNITAPNPIQPRDGQRIFNDAQPITLMLDNAASNSVRPFSYLIEVASDAGFANKVFSIDGVSPNPLGRTNFVLPQALASGKAYWWRAKAKDGANDGPYSPSANFEVIVPVAFAAPGLVAPIGDATVTTLRPTFSWNNAVRTGNPVGTVSYDVDISEDPSFLVKASAVVVEQIAGVTSGTAPEDAKVSRRYYWRARAKDLVTSGPWSTTQSFVTPAAAPQPSPGGGGNPSGCHIAPGAATLDRATQVVFGCGVEFPGLLAPTSGEAGTNANAEQLLLRTLWHLQLAGFQSARQKNPSGTISNDKINIFTGGTWRVYDIYGLGLNGVTISGLNEICPTDPACPNPQASSGIPD